MPPPITAKLYNRVVCVLRLRLQSLSHHFLQGALPLCRKFSNPSFDRVTQVLCRSKPPLTVGLLPSTANGLSSGRKQADVKLTRGLRPIKRRGSPERAPFPLRDFTCITELSAERCKRQLFVAEMQRTGIGLRGQARRLRSPGTSRSELQILYYRKPIETA